MLAQEAHRRLAGLLGEEQVGLITGEERINEHAPVLCCTVEMAPGSGEVLVLDEVQWADDEERGAAWTELLLAGEYRHIRLLGALDALPLVRRAFPDAVLRVHERKLPLEFVGSRQLRSLTPGSVVVAFSRKAVLALAGEINRLRPDRVAVLYGAMPLASRREEIDRFLAGSAEVCVATDVLGHGVNLPCETLLFAETTKFDGVERRTLLPWELAQIAGRAGRFGLVERGHVGVLVGAAVGERGPGHRRVRARAARRAPRGTSRATGSSTRRGSARGSATSASTTPATSMRRSARGTASRRASGRTRAGWPSSRSSRSVVGSPSSSGTFASAGAASGSRTPGGSRTPRSIRTVRSFSAFSRWPSLATVPSDRCSSSCSTRRGFATRGSRKQRRPDASRRSCGGSRSSTRVSAASPSSVRPSSSGPLPSGSSDGSPSRCATGRSAAAARAGGAVLRGFRSATGARAPVAAEIYRRRSTAAVVTAYDVIATAFDTIRAVFPRATP